MCVGEKCVEKDLQDLSGQQQSFSGRGQMRMIMVVCGGFEMSLQGCHFLEGDIRTYADRRSRERLPTLEKKQLADLDPFC
jgi:hypothetical protein